MAKKPDPFNNPFKGLKLPPAKAPGRSRTPERAAPVAPPARGAGEDEAEQFRRAVGGVEKVVRGPKVVTSGPPPTDFLRIRSEDEEALETLALLVAGEAPLDLADSDEFIEGHVGGLDAGILRRLRAGEYAVQGHLDLHGMVRAEAKPALEAFITGARRDSKRCVLVVHGRGLHSKDQLPVLKEGVQQWLSQGRLARCVLAFCSARPHDGGAGAVYVLLRR